MAEIRVAVVAMSFSRSEDSLMRRFGLFTVSTVLLFLSACAPTLSMPLTGAGYSAAPSGGSGDHATAVATTALRAFATTQTPPATATSAPAVAPPTVAPSKPSSSAPTSLTSSGVSGGALVPIPTGYHIVWQDEFSGSSLDSSKWLVSDSTRPDSSDGYIVGDHFSAGYAAANVTVSGGQVHLRTDHVAYAGKQYRSAGISTYQKYYFTSGSIIVRARLPQVSRGAWPAIWLIAADSNDNAQYEYDLMECAGGSTDFPTGAHRVQMTQHDWTAGNWQTDSASSAYDYAASFHNYEIDRTSNGVTYKLDGKTMFTVTGSHAGGVSPAWLIINTQVGDSGSSDSWSPSPDSSTVMPISFDIESVTYAKP